MTIVRPNRDKDLKRCVWGCCLATGSLIAVLVFSYLNLVGLKHDLSGLRENSDDLKIENAELKSSYYQLTSTENLEELANNIGLVKDKNPGWLVASQL
ncbi:MAG: hypothetical protein A2Y84_00945 [Candidatus Colwellbacteria bacterium RBG_13_48_8]|uniref:Cell division protein FtsL n=1 Tax=Candidatus Colwellbacteria bacterium RBG_13_48_8 TaxID=1797685 RepID=A0A1G1YZU0_9BACT|nr:MAG: hypothetical protein A2Y84_00945 [Candidatus Colwellbacteria bacterium RBG_13_48_8]